MVVGVNYAAGPIGVSASRYVDRADIEQEQDAFELGAKYKLGPGVEARGSFLYAEGDKPLA